MQIAKKTGDLITLKYKEVKSEIKNLQATRVENINPFNVLVFAGSVVLDPPTDNWVRTIYHNDYRIESSGARWVERSNVISDTTSVDVDRDRTEREVIADQDIFRGNHTDITRTKTTTTTRRVETEFTSSLKGPTREFDYVESVKISGQTDPFMRSRNVAFSANGLKAATKHYAYLDSGIPDLFPKLIEINMVSGTFSNREPIQVLDATTGKRIARAKLQAPAHKYHDTSPEAVPIGQANGSAEKYQVDPFDRDRPALHLTIHLLLSC